MADDNKHITASMGGGGAHTGTSTQGSQNQASISCASSHAGKHSNSNAGNGYGAKNAHHQSGPSASAAGHSGQQASQQVSKRNRKRNKNQGQPFTDNATSSFSHTSKNAQQANQGHHQKRKGGNKRAFEGPKLANFGRKGAASEQDYSHLLGFQAAEDTVEFGDVRGHSRGGAGRRRNRGYSSAHAPTFTKDQFLQAAFKFIVKPLRRPERLSKAASVNSASSDKDILNEQRRHQVIEDQQARYISYLNDPSAVVEWQDVVEVEYTPPNAQTSSQKTQCPICMEPAGFIVAPRVTKCGHLFCYACLLQYLDFEAEFAWKKCPLCNESIYKRDIRKASIMFDQRESLLLQPQSSSVSQGKVEEVQFRLMVRNKSNILTKRKIWLSHIDGTIQGSDEESKQGTIEDTSMTILESKLPEVDQTEYAGSRIRIANESYLRCILQKDLEQLQRDKIEKESYNSEDQVYYLEEAIEYCQGQLRKQEGELTSIAGHVEEGKVDSSEMFDTFISTKQINKNKILKKQISLKEQVIAENSDTCFYFYQAVSGENLYLHPLNLEMLNYERTMSLERQAQDPSSETAVQELPSLITGKVIEMNGGGMNPNGHAFDCDFLAHLPPAASYQLVEVDLKSHVSEQTLAQFERQLNQRQKARANKAAKEKKYNDRVEKTNDNKFKSLKEQLLADAGLLVRKPSQPVINYLAQEQAQIEEEEKKMGPAVPKKEPVGFIGLDDDDDHGLERAFGVFQRKGQGGNIPDDRGGGLIKSTSAAATTNSIWSMAGGLDQLTGGQASFHEAMFERQLQEDKEAERLRRQQRQMSDLSDGKEPASIEEAVASLGIQVQVNQGGGGKGGRKKKWKKV